MKPTSTVTWPITMHVNKYFSHISHVPTKEMLADVLTKPLGAPEFDKFISQLMTDAPIKV